MALCQLWWCFIHIIFYIMEFQTFKWVICKSPVYPHFAEFQLHLMQYEFPKCKFHITIWHWTCWGAIFIYLDWTYSMLCLYQEWTYNIYIYITIYKALSKIVYGNHLCNLDTIETNHDKSRENYKMNISWDLTDWEVRCTVSNTNWKTLSAHYWLSQKPLELLQMVVDQKRPHLQRWNRKECTQIEPNGTRYVCPQH